MKKGIIGKKLGMTQIFDEKGNVIPVTLIEAGPCAVAQKKTVENDGYNAVQLAFEDVSKKNVNKAQLGHFEKAGISPKRHLKEFRFDDITSYEVGSVVTVETFAKGDKVDITGITKGRGYSGCVKRWGHHILRMTHVQAPYTASAALWELTPHLLVFTRTRRWQDSTVTSRLQSLISLLLKLTQKRILSQ